ncbi:hypothetical protein SDC9_177257 [bioreactor metagenome]|uniref:Uncharacterized protein n=1 Tax=bioreactor metagenome TaxID=1076179 RepID=A0A645H0G2_9ZZZZ
MNDPVIAYGKKLREEALRARPYRRRRESHRQSLRDPLIPEPQRALERRLVTGAPAELSELQIASSVADGVCFLRRKRIEFGCDFETDQNVHFLAPVLRLRAAALELRRHAETGQDMQVLVIAL